MDKFITGGTRTDSSEEVHPVMQNLRQIPLPSAHHQMCCQPQTHRRMSHGPVVKALDSNSRGCGLESWFRPWPPTMPPPPPLSLSLLKLRGVDSVASPLDETKSQASPSSFIVTFSHHSTHTTPPTPVPPSLLSLRAADSSVWSFEDLMKQNIQLPLCCRSVQTEQLTAVSDQCPGKTGRNISNLRNWSAVPVVRLSTKKYPLRNSQMGHKTIPHHPPPLLNSCGVTPPQSLIFETHKLVTSWIPVSHHLHRVASGRTDTPGDWIMATLPHPDSRVKIAWVGLV